MAHTFPCGPHPLATQTLQLAIVAVDQRLQLLFQPFEPSTVSASAPSYIILSISGPVMSAPITPNDFQYRAEIDGLRALAVIAVVLCHAKLGVTGGFVGVDVFFVISGFLITSLIWRELNDRSFSFANFWERRARRIIPAMAVLILAVAAVGWLLCIPVDFKTLGASTAVQAVFGANFYYRHSIDYFHPDAEVMPPLHTWSLAVEEQFYLVVPFALVVLHRISGVRRQSVVMGLLGIGLLLSLVISAYFLRRSPSAVFYLLPCRAWELMTGAILALLPAYWIAQRPLLREVASLAGIAGIIAPCLFYSRLTPFPGPAALPPCLGTALIIWANSRQSEVQPPTFVGRQLTSKPFVFIGLISYSLYLWHWPILAFYFYHNMAPSSLLARLTLVGFASVASVLSWLFVETPFRKRIICASRQSLLCVSVAALTVVLLVGATINLLDGVPARLPKRLTAGNNSASSFWQDVSTNDIRANHLIQIGKAAGPIQVLIWGDSYAKASLEGFDSFLKSKGWGGRAITCTATAPVFGHFVSSNPFGLLRASPDHNEAVYEYIKREHVTNVVLVADWDLYGPAGTFPLYPDSICLKDALLITIKQLVQAGVRPWLMIGVPAPGFDVPRALARQYFLGKQPPLTYKRPTACNALTERGGESLEEMRAAGCRLLDPRPYFLDPMRHFYMIEANGRPLFFDKGHLTKEGSLLLVPMLCEHFTLGDVARPPGHGTLHPAKSGRRALADTSEARD